MFELLSFVAGPVQTNCYVLCSGKRAVVIDPGDRGKELYTRIVSRGLTVDAILLTHGHFDHIGGVNELKELSGAPVYVSENDAEMLHDGKKNFSVYFGMAIDSVSFDHTVKDGDVLTFGEITLKVLETPGHSKGSVVYRTEDCLFTGDTLFQASAGRTDGYGGSERELLASLRRLYDLPGDYKVYPGHGESTTLQIERETNEYMGICHDESDF